MSNNTENPYFEGIFTVDPLDPEFIIEPPPSEEPMDLKEEVNLMLREIIEESENIINIDSGENNSDWIKSLSWDLPTSAKDLITAIGGPKKWDHFKTLPSYRAIPEGLEEEVDLYIKNMKVEK
jgi:hypothetical protein